MAADSAFERYVMSKLPSLIRTARALSADSALAEDLVQEVLIRVHDRWDTISRMDRPDAYIHRMLVNEFLGWRRKWGRLVPHADPHLASPTGTSDEPDHAESSADRDALMAEIRKLPLRQRAVIGLRYLDDLDDTAIAQALGCSQSTVRVHASRALASLRIARDRSDSHEMNKGP